MTDVNFCLDTVKPVSAEEIVRNYQPLVQKEAGKYRLASAEREDLLQEGYLALVEGCRDYNPNVGVYLPAYLQKKVQNKIFNFVRKERNKSSGLISLNQNQEGGESSALLGLIVSPQSPDQINSLPDRLAVKEMLALLPRRQKEIIGLIFFQGRTLQDTANYLAMSKQAVLNMKKRALNKLRSISS